MIRVILITLVAMTSTALLNAQKLPDVQNSLVIAPANLRIDGKLAEWGDSFAAENKRTNLYYTLTNDSNTIYLAVKSVNEAAAAKIILGGISFSINTKGKRKDESSFTITYPLMPRNVLRGGGQNRQRGGSVNTQSKAQRDSATLIQRRTQLASIKEIKVQGFKSIVDSLISIYNEYGIKTVGKIDDDGAYCYELAIPLAMLEVPINSVKEIAYRIRLNGRPTQVNFNRSNAGPGRGGVGGADNAARQDLLSTTDFWGKYTLNRN